LRSTWDEVFPLKKLYALDVRVNSLDPAWPIKPLPPNINSSIHVNPRFLKQVAPATTPSSLTQEQLIRQQLLAKQKQLLELQQKKIELELEQTKAQLVGQGGLVMPPSSTVPAPAESSTAQRPGNQNPPGIRPWIPPQPPTDSKPSTRDPRLNRSGPPALPPLKEHPTAKRESPHPPGGPVVTTEKRVLEKPPRLDKAKTPRKEVLEEKLKSKSPSPLAKGLQSKSKQAEVENPKPIEAVKKDPRLKKRLQEKTGEVKDDELKEKKRCIDKKEREEASRRPELLRSNKAKLVNGLMAKHDYMESSDKADLKAGGNARRKRTCSRSRSRSPAASPKRKDRRSPKSHTRSSSLSPSHKPGKPRRVRGDDPQHGKPGREDRPAPKKIQSESRRPKRSQEDRQSRESHSPRGHDSGGKETKESLHRWRSGWEENKQLCERKPAPQASKRLESGEISQEDFLNMAHQIKHFFQYQEEKQQRSENWEDPGDFSIKKQSLLNTPHTHEAMDAAELSYYEHKSKLRKTQVNHRVTGDDGQETSEDGGEIRQGEKLGGSRSAGLPSLHAYSRPLQDRTGERRSKERDEPRPPLAPMVEEYNHGKEFPKLKSLPGLRFRRRVDPGESSKILQCLLALLCFPGEREWTSPLTERQLYDEREEHKSSYDAPRRYCPVDARRQDGPSPSTGAHRSSPAPVGLEAPAPRFERERLSPLHQKDLADMSPVPRFESPNSEHSDEGPMDVPPPHPPHEGGHPPSRYMGPSRPHHPGWYEGGGPGHFEEPQFDGPHHPGPGRFDGGGPPHHNLSERTESSGPHEGLRMVMRGGGDGIGPLEGPPQGPNRFGGPIGQQQPVRFEGQMGGPGHLEGPLQRFDGPGHFNNMGPGPMGFQQQRSLRFEGPNNQMGPIRFDGPSRFEGPGPGPRFDVPGGPHQPRFDYPPGQQGPPRFPPQPNLQLPMQPMAPSIYDNPITPQQNFGMAPQRFPEPMNPQFPPGPNMLPAGNFSMQPAPFSQPGPGPFYNPAAPAIGMQQPVSLLLSCLARLLTVWAFPGLFCVCTEAALLFQVAPPENHFGQVDVNDLLSKLISNGIIKPPSQTDSSQTASGQRYESVVTKLYSGNQCCLCSMRFTTTQTDMYADHLDWHFRQNHAGKVASKKVTHRRWYYSLTDWIEFEEIADLEERAKSHFFEKENEEEVQKNQAAAKEKEFQSVRATKDQVGENFHPACFEDYKNVSELGPTVLQFSFLHVFLFIMSFSSPQTSSYLDVTPSPSRLLTEHPLGALVKTEQEEEEVTSCEVKQEVQSDPCCVAQQEEPGSTAQGVSADCAQSEDKA
ncbi:hypothetical protein XENOCAPTIV_005920, partial [Xenoophorus captivus]